MYEHDNTNDEDRIVSVARGVCRYCWRKEISLQYWVDRAEHQTHIFAQQQVLARTVFVLCLVGWFCVCCVVCLFLFCVVVVVV